MVDADAGLGLDDEPDRDADDGAPSREVPDDQWWHSTGRNTSPPTSTRMPQVVGLIWSGGDARSISIARTSAPQTTGAPVRSAMLGVSP